MFERAQVRMLPVVNRASEHAPMVTACCNVCRTCTTTNLVGLVTAGGVAIIAATKRLFARH
jgi:hypothetical protein